MKLMTINAGGIGGETCPREKLELLALEIIKNKPDFVFIQEGIRGFIPKYIHGVSDFIKELSFITDMKCHQAVDWKQTFGLTIYTVGVLSNELLGHRTVRLSSGREVPIVMTNVGSVASVHLDPKRDLHLQFNELLRLNLTVMAGDFNHERESESTFKVIAPFGTFKDKRIDYFVVPADWTLVNANTFDIGSDHLGVVVEVNK